MARRSSGGRSAPRPTARAAPMKNPPQSACPAPPPAPAQGGGLVLGRIGAMIEDGLAWGTGIAIAQRVVDSLLGPRTVQHEMVVSPSAPPAAASDSMGSDACSTHSKAFQDCINDFGSDISKCQFYLDMLNECRRAPTPVLGV